MRLLILLVLFFSFPPAALAEMYRCSGGVYTDKPESYKDCVNSRTKTPYSAESKRKAQTETSTYTQRGPNAKWYEGGSLYKSSVGEWRVAPAWNRLATSGDFAAKILDGRFSSMEVLKERADELSACISEAVSEARVEQPISEVAAACAILMGWPRS